MHSSQSSFWQAAKGFQSPDFRSGHIVDEPMFRMVLELLTVAWCCGLYE
jgi:hypothetical protein